MRFLLDIIGSSAIGMYFIYMVLNFNIKMNDSLKESVTINITKLNVIGLNKLFDYDFNKIGYRVDSTNIFSVANEDEFNFLADIDNNGTVDNIHYILGTIKEASNTANPKDKPLYRIINNSDTTIHLVKTFEFSYLDSNGTEIPTSNLTTKTEREKIKGICVNCCLEPPFANNEEYQSIEWEKKFFPKNIN